MNPSPVVVTTSPLHPEVEHVLMEWADLRTASAPTAEHLSEAARDADVLIVRDPLPAGLLSASPRLRATIRHGAGVDIIPVAEATECGVLVAAVAGANARSVAEHVVLAALALSRRLPRMHEALSSGGGWDAARMLAPRGRDLNGGTLGLVGTGNIGRAVAHIAANGLGMRVLGTGSGRGPIPEGIEPRSLPELLADSDIVVLACPSTPETHHLIDADALAAMRPEALLINVARGAVVDDEALLASLRGGRIGGAALDVFVEEPLPADHPYLVAENVLVTPHVAGITDDSMRAMGLGAVSRAQAVLAGDLPEGLVNPEAIPRHRRRWPTREEATPISHRP